MAPTSRRLTGLLLVNLVTIWFDTNVPVYVLVFYDPPKPKFLKNIVVSAGQCECLLHIKTARYRRTSGIN